MKHFAIKDLERFSGIKAHTLRTWEQRYGVLKPVRIQGNTRSYSLNEFGELLNIALLNRNGYKISHLSSLHSNTIRELLKQLKNHEAACEIALNEIIMGMYNLDIDAIDAILDKCFLQWPYHTVFDQVILPFLKKTELLWQGNRLTEEHLVVTTLRKKIMWGIEKINTAAKRNNLVLLFLPDTKQLDLGLLYMNYQLKLRAVPVLYMGNDVSIDNLVAIFNKVKPHHLYTYISKCQKLNLPELSSAIDTFLPGSKIVITPGSDAVPVSFHNTIYLNYDSAFEYLSRG